MMNFLLGFDARAHEVSLHPPHLINSSGSLTPAALIPFCAYQTDMTLLGENRQDFPFQACNKFQTTVLDGQICYTLKLSSKQTGKSKSGKQAGLMMLIDQGVVQMKTQRNRPLKDLREELKQIDLESLDHDDNTARIYLNTLASFSDTRAGSYGMSSLKKMTGTDSFLKQTDEQKNCRIQSAEDCQAKEYIEKVREECGCIPWPLRRVFSSQVTLSQPTVW